MTKYTSRDQAVEVAIDQILADDDDGQVHHVHLHIGGCPADVERACVCPRRTLIMPSPNVNELWWWARAVDRLARSHFRDT